MVLNSNNTKIHASTPPRLHAPSNHSYFAAAEEAIDTSGYYHVLDHIAVYFPCGIALNFPGYIVGFEETAIHLVTNSRNDVALDETAESAGYTVDRLMNAFKYDVPFISQVMRYEGRPYCQGNCALYSLYYDQGAAVVNPCNGRDGERPRGRVNQSGAWRLSRLRGCGRAGGISSYSISSPP